MLYGGDYQIALIGFFQEEMPRWTLVFAIAVTHAQQRNFIQPQYVIMPEWPGQSGSQVEGCHVPD